MVGALSEWRCPLFAAVPDTVALPYRLASATGKYTERGRNSVVGGRMEVRLRTQP
jgi:hypothetical protein